MITSIIGIEISKQHLSVFDSHFQKHLHFFNSPDGIQKLIQYYADFPQKKVLIEGTGTYHQRFLHQKIEQAGFTVSLVKAYKVYCFSKNTGLFPKPDKIDSKVLCTYGQYVDCPQTLADVDYEDELRNVIACKERIQNDIDRLTKEQQEEPVSTLVQTTKISQRIDDLKFQLKKIRERLGEE